MAEGGFTLEDLDTRSREIFRRIVDMYLEHGDPVGSRTLSRRLDDPLSPASIRNVMQDLEELGLIAAPHVSAGRIPTEQGLRLFLDGLLQVGEPRPEERSAINAALKESDGDIATRLGDASAALSGLSQCASLVIAPKRDVPIEHVEVAPLSDGRALAIVAMSDGSVENRLFAAPAGMTPSAMTSATNFLNAYLRGRTLAEARDAITKRIAEKRAEIDEATSALIEAGVAEWSGSSADDAGPALIVRGLSNLLADNSAAEELDRVRRLFDDLERKRDIEQLLGLAEGGHGVRIFLGAENSLFAHSGSSLILSPCMDTDKRIVGALGVIGPTRLNYARIVPIVDYTARMLGRVLDGRSPRKPTPTTEA